MNSHPGGLIIYVIAGVVMAFITPITIYQWVQPWGTQGVVNTAITVGLVIGVIYAMMCFSVGVATLHEYVPKRIPLGPSYMIGNGIILATFAIGMLALPGFVWLWILPFDSMGRLDFSEFLHLDWETETPHHA